MVLFPAPRQCTKKLRVGSILVFSRIYTMYLVFLFLNLKQDFVELEAKCMELELKAYYEELKQWIALYVMWKRDVVYICFLLQLVISLFHSPTEAKPILETYWVSFVTSWGSTYVLPNHTYFRSHGRFSSHTMNLRFKMRWPIPSWQVHYLLALLILRKVMVLMDDPWFIKPIHLFEYLGKSFQYW